MRPRPTPDEIAQVKAEGRQYGWLRSRLLGLPWPREGISACGRPGCPVCDAAAREVADKLKKRGAAR
jgi:hypothetical protein